MAIRAPDGANKIEDMKEDYMKTQNHRIFDDVQKPPQATADVRPSRTQRCSGPPVYKKTRINKQVTN